MLLRFLGLFVVVWLNSLVGVQSQNCAGDSGLHTCGTVESCTNGTIVKGLCPGGEDNVCCLVGDTSACTAQSGTCVKATTCDSEFGDLLDNLCPGDSSVKCCVPKASGTTCPGESAWNLCVELADCTGGTPVGELCDGNDVCCVLGNTSQCDEQGGTCMLESTCEANLDIALTGLCPGSSNIKCCVATGSQQETCEGQDSESSSCQPPGTCTSGVVVNNLCSGETSNECCLQGSDSQCRAQNGVCRRVDDCVSLDGTLLTGLCPGNSDIRCCVPKSEPDAPGPIRENCFPLQYGSLDFISVNWGSRRSGGSRCHAGIDIYTQAPGQVVAVEDGVVTNIFGFLSCKDGWSMPEGTRYVGPKQATMAIMVYNEAKDLTYNYGEVDHDQINVGIGDTVTKGDILGRAGYCGMLHFELYDGTRTTNQRWFPPEGQLSEPPDKCATDFMDTKPSDLMDPRPLILDLQDQSAYCGPNGRAIDEDGQFIFFPTTSPTEPAPTSIPPDSTTAIVVVSLTGAGLIAAGIVTARVVMKQRNRSRGPKTYIYPPDL